MMTHDEAYEVDVLRELINIGVGRAAGALNQLLHTHVNLRVPQVRIFSPPVLPEAILKEFTTGKLSCVQISFYGPFAGYATLVFPPDSASNLVDIITGEKPDRHEMDALQIGALTEVSNIVINSVMGSISNVLKQHIRYTLPTYVEDSVERLLKLELPDSNATLVLAQTHFMIDQLCIGGDIILLFEMGSFDALLDAIGAIRVDQRVHV